MAHLLLQPKPSFDPDTAVGASLATRWKTWLDDFDTFLVANGITKSHGVFGSLISDNKSIVEPMNNFFCSIENTLSGKIPETPNPLLENECTVKPQDIRFEFKAVDMYQ